MSVFSVFNTHFGFKVVVAMMIHAVSMVIMVARAFSPIFSIL